MNSDSNAGFEKGGAVKPLQILHLEDDRHFTALVDETIASEGLASRILRVESAQEYTEALREQTFDVILADYNLPSFDALAALCLARQMVPVVPFILVSGCIGEETAIEALKAGATDYILKNNLARLVPSIRRALRETENRERAIQAELREASLKRIHDLVTITGEILAEKTFTGIFQKISGAVRKLTGAKYATGLGLLGDDFGIVGFSGDLSPYPCQPVSFRKQRGGIYERLLSRDRSILLSDVQLKSDPLWWGLPDYHLPLRGLVGARLVGRTGKPIGIIMGTDKADGGEFNDEDEVLLVQLAALASLGIQQILALEEAERQAKTLNLLAQTAGKLLAAENPEEIAFSLCTDVMHFLDCDLFFNFLWDEEKGRLRLNAYSGIPGEEAQKLEWLDLGVAVCGCVAQGGNRIIAEGIQSSNDTQTDLVKSYGVQAYACHPLIAGQRLLGTLSFGTRNRSTFTSEQVALMKAVVDQVAIAMERKRVEEALQKTHAELERRVAERTEELSAAFDALHDEVVGRMKVVEELRESERLLILQSRQAAMGEMISNIAHQWRQPLNVVGLNIQSVALMQEMGELTPEYLTDKMNATKEVVFHMSRTIDDFRNFFRPEKDRTLFKVKEVVDRTVSIIEGSFASHLIRISVKNDADPVIEGFPNEYCQVLLNILVNARDAFAARETPEPHVEVFIGEEAGKSVVTIADNAGGIDEHILPKIFDPYFTTKDADGGTGIGLFMSKTIIEKNMYGLLTARNAGAGAEFRIEISVYSN